jgi:hypothetical protein
MILNILLNLSKSISEKDHCDTKDGIDLQLNAYFRAEVTD